MNCNVSAAIATMSPWDFSLTVNDREFKTVRPTIGQTAMIQTIATVNDRDALKIVAGLFEAPQPNVAEWSIDEVAGVIAAYMKYLQWRLEKNSPAVTAHVATVMEKAIADQTK